MTTTYYDIDTVIKNALESATGKNAYCLEKPKDVAIPCVVYKRISENLHLTMQGRPQDKFTSGRFQVTMICDSYDNLRTMVKQVKDKFIGNTTDFIVSTPTEEAIEDKEDNVYYAIRDYFISWKEDLAIVS